MSSVPPYKLPAPITAKQAFEVLLSKPVKDWTSQTPDDIPKAMQANPPVYMALPLPTNYQEWGGGFQAFNANPSKNNELKYGEWANTAEESRYARENELPNHDEALLSLSQALDINGDDMDDGSRNIDINLLTGEMNIRYEANRYQDETTEQKRMQAEIKKLNDNPANHMQLDSQQLIQAKTIANQMYQQGLADIAKATQKQ